MTDQINDVLDPVLSRREAVRAGAGAGSKIISALGLGAIPLALAALAREAEAQTSTDLMDALQFLLLIEQVTVTLHLRALSVSGFVPTTAFPIFQAVHAHDADHVTLLSNMITSQSGTPADAPSFDWTAKGNFPGFAFASGQYPTYLIIAQGLADLAVRAYKGQAARMTVDLSLMTQTLVLHSVEGRHAAAIRRVRNMNAWITAKSRDDLPAFFQPVYDGEDATVHDGFDAATLAGSDGGTNSVTEAFDEPLTKAQARAIVTPFLA
jgi:hypothetical protein